MNALLSAMTNEEFKKISSTESAKEAWTILLLRGKFFCSQIEYGVVKPKLDDGSLKYSPKAIDVV